MSFLHQASHCIFNNWWIFTHGFPKQSLWVYKSLFTVWSVSPSKCYFQLLVRRRRIHVWKTWAHAARAVIRANLRQSACWFSSSVTDIEAVSSRSRWWRFMDGSAQTVGNMITGQWLQCHLRHSQETDSELYVNTGLEWNDLSVHSRNSLTLEMRSRKLDRNLMFEVWKWRT